VPGRHARPVHRGHTHPRSAPHSCTLTPDTPITYSLPAPCSSFARTFVFGTLLSTSNFDLSQSIRHRPPSHPRPICMGAFVCLCVCLCVCACVRTPDARRPHPSCICWCCDPSHPLHLNYVRKMTPGSARGCPFRLYVGSGTGTLAPSKRHRNKSENVKINATISGRVRLIL
jgi:hypothetical protein